MIKQLSFSMPTVFELADIEKACFGVDAWSISALRGEFNNDYSYFFAEEVNGVIAGYLCVRIVYEEAQVCNVAVLPQYRKQGIATKLVQHLIEFSKQQQCEKIELEVNVCNQPAIALYEKCGFVSVGKRVNFYRKTRFDSRDAYTMIYDLTK